MIFDSLNESNERGELLLVEGGMCHWHLRRDGQLTIREIIVTAGRQRQGIGRSMIDTLAATPGATSIFAKCPATLPANDWYAALGFAPEGTETTLSGKTLNLWRLKLSIAPTVTPDSRR